MPKQERHYAWTGVYYVKANYTAKIEDSDLIDKPFIRTVKAVQWVFYIIYPGSDGKPKEPRVGGTAWEGMTSQKAENIRRIRELLSHGKMTEDLAQKTEVDLLCAGMDRHSIARLWLQYRLEHNNSDTFAGEERLFKKYIVPLISPYCRRLRFRNEYDDEEEEDLINEGEMIVIPELVPEPDSYSGETYFYRGQELAPWEIMNHPAITRLHKKNRFAVFALLVKLARLYFNEADFGVIAQKHPDFNQLLSLPL